MNASKRVFVNTIAQYVRAIIGGILTLYAARVILKSLGADDFGIYSLVAGVVMMLSFITNALSSTTQRFISYYQGRDDKSEVKVVFNNSLFLHLGIGLVVVLLLGAFYPFLFHVIEVSDERTIAASYVYISVVLTLLLSFITSPFRAVLISHENIVYISIIDLLDVVLKLIIALSLQYVSYDRLVYYGIALTGVQLFNLIAFSFFCFKKYDECTQPKVSDINRTYLKGLSNFAGWSIYTIGCQIGRTQGLAIVVNRTLGTIANAAYGIGIQISSYCNFVSDALLNSLRPQIIKAEGNGERNKMLNLSLLACKYGFFLMSLVCIPCIFEAEELLTLWLGDVPNYSVGFTRMYLVAMVVDMLTYGFNITNQAVGKLKTYTLLVNTWKLLTVPICLLLLKCGISFSMLLACYVLIELMCSIIRVPVIKSQTGLSYKSFIKSVVARVTVPLVIFLLLCFIICYFVDYNFRILLTFGLSCLIYTVLFYFLGMDKQERTKIMNIILKKRG